MKAMIRFLFGFGLLIFSCSPKAETQNNENAVKDAIALRIQQKFYKAVLTPGKGIDGIELNKTTYAELIEILGDAASTTTQEVSEGCHPSECQQKGYTKYSKVKVKYADVFTFGFENMLTGWKQNDLLVDSIEVDCQLKPNCAFNGLTAEGIKMGHQIERLKDVYGEPIRLRERLNTPCFSNGICFGFTRAESGKPRVIDFVRLLPSGHASLRPKNR